MTNNIFELEYKQLLMRCLLEGTLVNNRTKVKTYKLFNQSFNIDLEKGFPIVTGKKIFFEKALGEFEWIFNGRTDLEFLHSKNINWWDEFATDGKLGKIYGYQVRTFGGEFDQVDYCIEQIKNNSRRAVISLWNPADLKEQALPCCYTSFNFVRINDKLNMTMDFRSSDLFLGLPYDIIVGALLLIEVARECNLKPSKLGLNLKDAHIYEEHKEAVTEYHKAPIYVLPTINENKELNNYKSGKLIKAKLIN
jgi:thymidylate synthase